MEITSFQADQLHIAQQSRRERLRSTAQQHYLDEYPSSFPYEMTGLALPHQPMIAGSTFPNIHPSRFVAPTMTSGSYAAVHNGSEIKPSCENLAMITPHYSSSQAPLVTGGEMTVVGWGQGGNELALLPSFASQPMIDTSSNYNNGLSLTLSSDRMCDNVRYPQELKPFEYSGSVSSVVNANQIMAPGSSIPNANRSNVGPLGPFTGYTMILKSSKFLRPAQQLLEEFLNASGLRSVRGGEDEEAESVCGDSNQNRSIGDSSRSRCSSDLLSGGAASSELYRPDCQEKKAKLLHMQEEVCKRHKQYHQQMEMVMSAFESVPGLGNATPYIARSIKTISRHFRIVKNAIADQLKHIKRVLGEDLSSLPSSFAKGETANLRLEQHSFSKGKSGGLGRMSYMGQQNHIWRPQRGLPERAVSILRAWLFDHFLHPYPTDTDKQMLAAQTGLSRNQVSNWFINARVRLWKPMVEEIHTLETKGAAHSNPNPNTANHQTTGNCKQPLNMMMCEQQQQFERLGSSNSSIEGSRGNEICSSDQLFQKRSRMESHHVTNNSLNGSLLGFLPYQRRGGIEMGGIGAVSLTLGLRHGSEATQQQQHFQPQQGLHFGGHHHAIHDYSG